MVGKWEETAVLNFGELECNYFPREVDIAVDAEVVQMADYCFDSG